MENTTGKRIVDEFYSDEEEGDRNEAFSMKFTATSQVSDLTMLDAIASRFGKTRASLVSEILHTTVLEMYFGLSLSDKESLSLKADLDTTSILQKKGVDVTTVGFDLPDGESLNEDYSWRGYFTTIKANQEV